MKPVCSFNMPREVCSEVSSIAQKNGNRFGQRPYNQYSPDDSDWWLIPSPDWPAFRHGKYYFRWGWENNKNIISCGYYIEKGLGKELSRVYTSAKASRKIMDDKWQWFRFLKDLQKGDIKETITKVANTISFPLTVLVDGGFTNNPEEFDPLAPKMGWDACLMEFDKNTQKLQIKEFKEEVHLLNEITHVQSMEDLSSVLINLNKNSWLWIDVFIGIDLQVLQSGETVSEETEFWNSEKLWNEHLKYFLPWVN